MKEKDSTETKKPSDFTDGGFWIPFQWPERSRTLRQYGMIFVVNLATFLQGASIGTSAISLPRMPTNESESKNATTWPADFVVTENDAYWISKCIPLKVFH